MNQMFFYDAWCHHGQLLKIAGGTTNWHQLNSAALETPLTDEPSGNCSRFLIKAVPKISARLLKNACK